LHGKRNGFQLVSNKILFLALTNLDDFECLIQFIAQGGHACGWAPIHDVICSAGAHLGQPSSSFGTAHKLIWDSPRACLGQHFRAIGKLILESI
jgi:hypothetical protein